LAKQPWHGALLAFHSDASPAAAQLNRRSTGPLLY